MNLKFRFDHSAFYQFTGAAASDQLDTNKLYGFSDCGSHHTQNSARLGFRDNEGRIEIMAFTHRAGRFYYEPLTTVEPNQLNEASISISDDKKSYVYEVNGVSARVGRGCEQGRAVGYHLQPYFGGNQTAPHDLKIRVDASGELAPVIADVPYPTVLNGGAFQMKVRASESVSLFSRLYDYYGRLVWESQKQDLEAGSEMVIHYQVNSVLQSGIYVLLPLAVTSEGTELRAALNSMTSSDVYRLRVQK